MNREQRLVNKLKGSGITINEEEARMLLEEVEQNNKIHSMEQTIFTNGCFDVLHVGHFNLLSYCRQIVGDEGKVMVALDSDEKIKNDKGNDRPFFSFEERKQSLLSLMGSSSIHLVDEVFSFNSNQELYELIKTINPNLLIKGADWDGNVVGSDLVEKVISFSRLPYSTTNISQKIYEKINK